MQNDPNNTQDTTRDDQQHSSQTRIEIFTDGSSIGNPGPGGYGIITLRRASDGRILKEHQRSGSVAEPTTNIRMEMTAVCLAIEKLGEVTDEPVTIFCDLNLIANTMNGWLAGWKARGWKKGNGKEPENRVLWERMEEAARGRNISFVWVRGHNGQEFNERADKIAYRAARRAEKAALEHLQR